MTDAQYQKANICALLNEILYLGFPGAQDGDTIEDIINMIGSNNAYASYREKPEYQILKENLDLIGNYEIGNQSSKMDGFNSGTNACTFEDPDTGKIYVVYRGTGDGEWLDNGAGMTQISTPQQEEAARYFDYVMEHNGWNASDNITVTGHSKGGNKSQYVTMNAEYRDYIDECYSLDGQGFSPEAIAEMKRRYGEDGYREAIEKMYSINGENDYVNVLGEKIVPDDHTFYIKTPAKDGDFVAGHDLKYFFAVRDENGDPVFVDGKQQFGGEMNPSATERGQLSLTAEELSKALMMLPPDKRDDVAKLIMQIMESSEGGSISITGEQLTVENVIGAIVTGTPTILFTLISTPEGRDFLATYGGMLLEAAYEKLGPVKMIGIAAVIIVFSPVIIRVTAMVYKILTFIDVVLDVLDRLKDLAEDLKQFMRQVCNDVKMAYESFLTGRKVKNPSASYQPGNEILLNVSQLRMIAGKLRQVQNRIIALDSDLNRLRRDQEWYEFFNKAAIGAIDFLYVGYDYDLAKCISYLDRVADMFEQTEQKLNSAARQY